MFIIEPADKNDAKTILNIQKLAFAYKKKLYKTDNLAFLKQTLNEIIKEFEYKLFLKAIINGKIVGSIRAWSDGKICYIERLFVHPDFQKQGIASALLKYIEKNMKNCEFLELSTGKQAENDIKFYNKRGFMEYEHWINKDGIASIKFRKKIRNL